MISEYTKSDAPKILHVINDASLRYKGIIPDNCWHEPYMSEQKLIDEFNDDCKYLNLDEPSQQPKATDHIDLMIEMVSSLIKKNFAYEKNNHVYFEVNKFKD